MSACGSPLSSNRRIEPAVAVKASVRPGQRQRLLGGRVRRQAMLLGGWRRIGGVPLRALPRPSGRPDVLPAVGVAAGGEDFASSAASWAQAPAATAKRQQGAQQSSSACAAPAKGKTCPLLPAPPRASICQRVPVQTATVARYTRKRNGRKSQSRRRREHDRKRVAWSGCPRRQLSDIGHIRRRNRSTI